MQHIDNSKFLQADFRARFKRTPVIEYLSKIWSLPEFAIRFFPKVINNTND